MSNQIDRQAVLDALGERQVVWSDNDDYTLGERNQYDMDRLAIETVPPAQPGQRSTRVFQGIIVEYSSISAYPEYEGKPYFSIKYTENGQGFIGYGTYKPEVLSEYLKEYFMPSTQPGWIPCSRELPKESGDYLVTIKYGEKQYAVDYLEYNAYGKEWNDGELFGWIVTAWQPAPKPWEGGQE